MPSHHNFTLFGYIYFRFKNTTKKCKKKNAFVSKTNKNDVSEETDFEHLELKKTNA